MSPSSQKLAAGATSRTLDFRTEGVGRAGAVLPWRESMGFGTNLHSDLIPSLTIWEQELKLLTFAES